MTNQEIKLITERDCAIKLAEEAENRLLDLQQEFEKTLQDGFQEAYEQVEKLRKENETLKGEVADLKRINEHLLLASQTNKTLAASLVFQMEQKKTELEQQYSQRLKEQNNIIVNKLDEFLREKYAEIDAHIAKEQVKKLMEKGSKQLVREVLGEEGTKIVEAMEKDEREEKRKIELRQAEAQEIRKTIRKKILVGGQYSTGHALGTAFGGPNGHPYYKKMSLSDMVAKTSVEDRVKEMVRIIHESRIE